MVWRTFLTCETFCRSMHATMSGVKQLAGLGSASLLAEILERRSDAGAGSRAGESKWGVLGCRRCCRIDIDVKLVCVSVVLACANFCTACLVSMALSGAHLWGGLNCQSWEEATTEFQGFFFFFASQTRHKINFFIKKFRRCKWRSKFFLFLAFIFCFKRELNPYSPLTYSLTSAHELKPHSSAKSL